MTHPAPDRQVIGGVDTHGRTHHAAVIDELGRHLADQEFPATTAGYRDLHAFLTSHGVLEAVGVEGTGAYGAELARHLADAGVTVIDVDRPDRKTRRTKGKSDPIDAYAAATAVASGRATGSPKTRTGTVEAIRTLRIARRSAVKARTQAMNQIRALIVTAPAVLREQAGDRPRAELIRTLAHLRPGTDLAAPLNATKSALRHLARRHQLMDEEIAELDTQITPLVRAAAPHLLALHTIVLVRMRYDERTRTYVQRRTTEGLSKKEIIRCLKRFVPREVYHALTTPSPAQTRGENPIALAA